MDSNVILAETLELHDAPKSWAYGEHHVKLETSLHASKLVPFECNTYILGT